MQINESALRRLVRVELDRIVRARVIREGLDDDDLGSGDPDLDRAWSEWVGATNSLVDLLDEDGTLLRSDVLLMMHDHLKRCRS